MLPGILVLSTLAYPPGTLLDTQTFSSAGAATWSKSGIPTASYSIIEIWAGGGSGGNAYDGGSSARGGYGGSYKSYQVDYLLLSATENVLIGAAGAAKKDNGNYGLPGGFSWFGEAIWAKGGAGGRGNFTGDNAASDYTPTDPRSAGIWTAILAETGATGGLGSSAGSNATYAGGGGGGCVNSGATTQAGGTSTYGGAGGTGYNSTPAGAITGTAPGGGGGAANWNHFTGAGGLGRIIIKTYA